MARRCGLFQSELSRMERGLRRGTEETVRALADVLQLDQAALLQTWQYVSDDVTAAILESDLPDEAKRKMLRLYDRIRDVGSPSGRTPGGGAARK